MFDSEEFRTMINEQQIAQKCKSYDYWLDDCAKNFRRPSEVNQEGADYLQSFLRERIFASAISVELFFRSEEAKSPIGYRIRADWMTRQPQAKVFILQEDKLQSIYIQSCWIAQMITSFNKTAAEIYADKS